MAQWTQCLEIGFTVIAVVSISMMELLELLATPATPLAHVIVPAQDPGAHFQHTLGTVPIGSMERQGGPGQAICGNKWNGHGATIMGSNKISSRNTKQNPRGTGGFVV